MKRILAITSFFLLTASFALGQIMQASIGAGATSKRIKFYIRPTAAFSGSIATFQFNVAINEAVTPAPTLAIVGTPAFGTSWNAVPSYIEDGYRHYNFISGNAGALTLAANQEFEVMELEFSGGSATPIDISLVTLPVGGVGGNALWYCTGDIESAEGQLYYSRPGTSVVNNNSYTGTLSSSATITGIVLPVSWLSFNAQKQANNAILNWEVGNELQSKNYEVQRSINATDYKSVGTLDNTNRGNYSFTDVDVNKLGVDVLYYRIKQTDINGRFIFSDVRTLKLNDRSTEITIYPNPAVEGFYLTLPSPQNGKVKLTLTAADGKLVAVKELNASQANNYYFDIKKNFVTNGQYNLQIIQDGKVISNKKLFINQ
jgi:hypothetical protein